ncbi:hypothetical protein CA13_43680 [Planctomycetes bacterium CA13]|uniref:Uncharacterized protein n=1 Tax=Novipirellula herctigrandis TaxID=2527986 RepID=A0A5C5Z6Q7_9BACT|nr:hypothetical protein CA13_43680 [Planctomycetes bacterium CA13]
MVAFAGSVVAVAIMWLVVLPGLSKRPAMRERLDWLDERGIDPSAMYYTELPVMEEILVRQRQRDRKSNDVSTQ